jgi:hypothetical protein
MMLEMYLESNQLSCRARLVHHFFSEHPCRSCHLSEGTIRCYSHPSVKCMPGRDFFPLFQHIKSTYTWCPDPTINNIRIWIRIRLDIGILWLFCLSQKTWCGLCIRIFQWNCIFIQNETRVEIRGPNGFFWGKIRGKKSHAIIPLISTYWVSRHLYWNMGLLLCGPV